MKPIELTVKPEPCMAKPYRPDNTTVPTLVTDGCPEGLSCVKTSELADVLSENARMGMALERLYERCGPSHAPD